MVPAFETMIKKLELNVFSDPFQTQFGWHVILREESRENQPPTLDSVRDVLAQRVEQAKFQNYLERLRAIYAQGD